jgi:hypothetical protein
VKNLKVLSSNPKVQEAQSLVSLPATGAQNTINVHTQSSGTSLPVDDDTQSLELQLKQFLGLKQKGIRMVR